MNRRVTLLGVVAVVAIVALWWVLLYSPASKQLSTQHANLSEAQRQTQQLQTQLNQLKDLSSRGTQLSAQSARLSAAVPATTDQAGFITSLNNISHASGITWQSVSFQSSSGGSSTATPAAASGAVSIPVQIQIKGGFFQLTDYLNRLERLGRLVVVDGVQISSGSSGSKSSNAGLTTSGSGALTVTLNARIFSQSPAPPAGGTGARPSAAAPNGGGSSTGGSVG